MARPIRFAALPVLVAAAAALLLAACFETRTIECQGGVVCPEGSVCTADGLGCTTNACGNMIVDSGEECDDGNQLENDDCLADCTLATCGDGRVNTEGENPEECDDNAANTADCDSDCTLPVCGDNLHNAAAGEACDDGDEDSNDGCKDDCTSTEACGNRIIDDHLPNNPTNSPATCLNATATGTNCAEVCDDGNNLAGDGCSPNCLSEEDCQNGILDVGEVCDDGDDDNNDTCRNDCTGGAGCGNGQVEGGLGEQCDNGMEGQNTVACDSDCSVPVCGDGLLNMSEVSAGVPLEECDPGTPTMPSIGQPSPSCNANCTVPSCGDGIVNDEFTPPGSTLTENCDDGGNVNGDGCDSLCRIEGCGNGVVEMSRGEQCDDGNMDDADACRNNCQLPRCGDGIASASEDCDVTDPLGDPTTCDPDCTDAECGDGTINTMFVPAGQTLPENCDDGGTAGGDGCSAVCRIETCGNGITEASNGEQCDDGDMIETNGCRTNCRLPACGDGVLSTSETCDASAPGGDPALCDVDCTVPACDDGILNTAAGEQCEDGNLNNGDGCSMTCRLESTTLNVVKNGTGTGTVTSAPAGINCGGDCAESYTPNTMVTLTAAASGVSVFTGWSGAPGCTTATTCMVTMDATKSVTATFDLNTLTVAKAGNGASGGTVSSNPAGITCGGDCSESYAAGTMVTLTAMVDSSTTFTGWSGGGCSGTSTCITTMNGAKTVTATFTLQTFNLAVSRSGTGSGTVQSIPAGIDCGGTCTFGFTAGTSVTLVATADANSTFTGWSGSGITCPGTGNCTVSMSQARSVTATFTLKTYTLTVNNDDDGNNNNDITSNPAGISCGNDCEGTYSHGTVVTLTPVIGSGDYFVGWSGAGCSGSSTCMITMDGNKQVSATFEDNRVTISRIGDGSGSVSGPTGTNNGISCGSNCVEDYNVNTAITLTATAAAGSRFVQWASGACAGSTSNTCMFSVTEAVTVEAEFADVDTVSLTKTGSSGTGTVTSDPAGINCGTGCSTTSAGFDDGTTVTLTATPAVGSVFIGWGGDCAGAGSNTTCVLNTIQSDRNVNAEFDAAFTLDVMKLGGGSAFGTVQSSPGGIDCGLDCTESYLSGTVVTLTASTTGGATFNSWSGAPGCTTNPSCQVTMSQARSVTATFDAPVFRTLTVDPEGTGAGSVDSAPAGILDCAASSGDCMEAYLDGTVVTLTATADPGNAFTGWSGTGVTCPGTGTCEVTLTANTTVVATFVPTFQMSVTIAGAGSGSVSSSPAGITSCTTGTCDATFNSGTAVTLTATPTGTDAVVWSGNCTPTGNTCATTMDAAKSVTATFVPTFALTVTVTGSGTVSAGSGTIMNCDDNGGSACTGNYNSGSTVTLTASGGMPTWGGCTTSTATTCDVLMDGVEAVTADFP
ncbi:MAG: DUF4215 domain-containing protein [Deltaproteobacteria bacterium]|nr:DUF4215 domain-containing protein [Kofleriaceae bacterium]